MEGGKYIYSTKTTVDIWVNTRMYIQKEYIKSKYWNTAMYIQVRQVQRVYLSGKLQFTTNIVEKLGENRCEGSMDQLRPRRS